MSRLDNDKVFHSTVSHMGGYGITSEYLNNMIDRHFPVEESYKMSNAIKNDTFYDLEDLYESSWSQWD